jgi:hypothetical protein
MTLRFGIYAGGLGALPDGTITPGLPEDLVAIDRALTGLAGDRPFLVRAYTSYRPGAGGDIEAPPGAERLVDGGRRRLDLVACFRHDGTDLDGWLDFLRALLRRYGPRLAKLQVTEEANHAGPGGDGDMPHVRQALVEGVVAARAEVVALGLDTAVGVNVAPMPAGGHDWWADLAWRAGDGFTEALGYVGLDLFPDVFHRIPAGELAGMVTALLRGMRDRDLPAGGIPPTVPIHITENGWATGPDRPEARQAEVLDEVVRTVAGLAGELNITAYEHFALRDADTAGDSPFSRLGLLRSDYTPKPAFDTYRDLIAELS